MTFAETVLAEARRLPEGTLLTAARLRAGGTRAATTRTLSRLAASGSLLRVARGTYVVPMSSRFGTYAPSPARVAEQMVACGEQIVPGGAAEANRLGLSTQVPMREVFVTSGRSRTIKLGAGALEIRHAPRWQTALGSTEASAAVRAMAWLGRSEARRAAAQLHARLPVGEWETLVRSNATLPSWMSSSIRSEAAAG